MALGIDFMALGIDFMALGIDFMALERIRYFCRIPRSISIRATAIQLSKVIELGAYLFPETDQGPAYFDHVEVSKTLKNGPRL